jgi:hypothetical protein
MLALAEVKCGISVHPSHTRICALLGEEERVILQQVSVKISFSLFGWVIDPLFKGKLLLNYGLKEVPIWA